jgi:hypothetical protein
LSASKTPEHLRWLKLNGHSLGPLTGQDHRALAAIAACWQLYFSGDTNGQAGAITAVRALLPAMQSKCWPMARELIAFAGEWSHRDQLWPLVAS